MLPRGPVSSDRGFPSVSVSPRGRSSTGPVAPRSPQSRQARASAELASGRSCTYWPHAGLEPHCARHYTNIKEGGGPYPKMLTTLWKNLSVLNFDHPTCHILAEV
ncbi:unnamed protein product [Natator depressus]